MTGAATFVYLASYLVAILCGLAAGVVVNVLADRVAPTPGPSPTGRGGVAGESIVAHGKQDDEASNPDPAIRHETPPRDPPPVGEGRVGAAPLTRLLPFSHPRSPHDPLPVGEGPGMRAIRRRVTPLALGALFPLLLAHALATAGSAPGRLPVWAVFVTQAVCVAVLAGVFVVDLEHRLIFDVAIFPPGIGLLALALVADRRALPSLALAAVLAGGVFLLFYGLGFLLYRQEAMGFGDVKLAALVGLIVGWPAITFALLTTAIVGAIASMLLLAFSDISRRAFIPFGVFLAVGALVALLAAPPVW